MKGFQNRKALVYLIGFVVARASFLSMNPLAIGYFTAMYLNKMGGGFAFLAIFLGVATSMNMTGILKYSLTLIATMILMDSPLLKNKAVPKLVQMFLPSLALLVFSLLEITAGVNIGKLVTLSILEGLIAIIAACIFSQAMEYVLEVPKGARMSNEQMVSIAIVVAILIYALPELENAYVAPIKTIVYFIILFFTYKYGAGQGTITGAVSGFALSLRGAPFTEIGTLTILGVIPAIFREMGKIPFVASFALITTMLPTFFDGMEFTSKDIAALISASTLFLLLPSNIVYRADAAGGTGRQEQLAAQNLRKIAKLRMNTFSESFLKLSKTLDTMTQQQTKLKQNQINKIFEEISEKLCKNCDQCGSCWEKNFQQTYQAATLMFDLAQEKGVIRKEDIPPNFLQECISIEDFISETNRGFEIAKLNHIWQSRFFESREIIAEQLKEVSEVITDITKNLYEAELSSHHDQERVTRKLKSEYIIAKDVTIIQREDGRKEVYLDAFCQGGRCVTIKEVALLISEALGVRMKPSEACKNVIAKEQEHYIFIEDTKFKVLTGVARAKKEAVSGDNFAVLKLESGEVMMAISDGMGTGKEAGEESETVMALLEQMLDAGFKAEAAIKLINSSLVLKSDQQTFSTIDLSIINLFTGMCEFIKLGAAAAFIKRENWVETISSTTLPIGMFGSVDYDTVTKKLYEGDIVIMVSDGVLDSLPGENKEEYMEQFLMEIKTSNPQELANRILDKTLNITNFRPMDDMSVITAGIWLK